MKPIREFKAEQREAVIVDWEKKAEEINALNAQIKELQNKTNEIKRQRLKLRRFTTSELAKKHGVTHRFVKNTLYN